MQASGWASEPSWAAWCTGVPQQFGRQSGRGTEITWLYTDTDTRAWRFVCRPEDLQGLPTSVRNKHRSLVKFMLMTLTHSIFYLLYFLRCISFFWFVYSSYFSAPLYLPWRGHYTNFWVADWLTFCRITRVTKIGFCTYCVMGTRWPLISGCHVMMKNNLLTVSLDQTIARLVPPKVFDISLIGVTTLKCVCGRPSGRHSGVCSRYSFAELYSDPNTYNAFVQPNVSGCALW